MKHKLITLYKKAVALICPKRKRKKKKYKMCLTTNISPEYSGKEITSYMTNYFSIGPCETHNHPIEDPETIQWILEALKPPMLPEQKVFNNVKDMMDKI